MQKGGDPEKVSDRNDWLMKFSRLTEGKGRRSTGARSLSARMLGLPGGKWERLARDDIDHC